MRWADLWHHCTGAVGANRPINTTEQSTGQWAGPELRMTFQPPYRGFELEPSDRWQTEGVWRPGSEAAAADSPVLVSSAKLTQTRHGLLGLSDRGRKWLLRASETLQEKVRTTAMVTGTFSRVQLEALAEPGCMSRFQKRLAEGVNRLLESRGLPAHHCLVWEEQPKRTAREGIPGMHYHLLAPYRSKGGRRAFITVPEWKLVHARALRASTGYDGVIEANGVRVEAVKTTCSRYLTSYLKKPAESPKRWAGTKWEGLVPKQWWHVSGDLRELILSRMREWDPGFLNWVGENGAELRARKLVRTVAVHEFADVAPTWLIWFTSKAALVQAVSWWRDWRRRRQMVGLYGGWEPGHQTTRAVCPSSA